MVMELIETKVIDFFNKWDLCDKLNVLDKVINMIELDREDAIMIFEDFLVEFDIEESSCFDVDLDKYFYKLAFLDALFLGFFPKRIEKKYAQKTPITVRHMIEVAKRKAWFDPQ